MAVIGIGTVRLPVRRSLQRSGPDGHGTLVIEYVLHAPSVICNIVCSRSLEASGYGATFGVTHRSYPLATGRIDSLATDETVALLLHGKGRYSDLMVIRLSGFPVGPRVAPTPPKDGTLLVLTITLSEEERKNMNGQLAAGRAAAQAPAAAAVTEALLNEDEKRFLKTNFRDEFHFLREHGLNIHKEEHREEGRALLRALMAQDEEDEEQDGDQGEDEDDYDFERHLADHHFTEEQLDFIERGYGSSMAFMHSFGLKFYNDEDCEEAKAIVEAFMTDD